MWILKQPWRGGKTSHGRIPETGSGGRPALCGIDFLRGVFIQRVRPQPVDCLGREGDQPEPDSKKIPKAPGMKYRHYAPKAELTIFKHEPDDVRQPSADGSLQRFQSRLRKRIHYRYNLFRRCQNPAGFHKGSPPYNYLSIYPSFCSKSNASHSR